MRTGRLASPPQCGWPERPFTGVVRQIAFGYRGLANVAEIEPLMVQRLATENCLRHRDLRKRTPSYRLGRSRNLDIGGDFFDTGQYFGWRSREVDRNSTQAPVCMIHDMIRAVEALLSRVDQHPAWQVERGQVREQLIEVRMAIADCGKALVFYVADPDDIPILAEKAQVGPERNA